MHGIYTFHASGTYDVCYVWHAHDINVHRQGSPPTGPKDAASQRFGAAGAVAGAVGRYSLLNPLRNR
jgi:hypothetical protein